MRYLFIFIFVFTNHWCQTAIRWHDRIFPVHAHRYKNEALINNQSNQSKTLPPCSEDRLITYLAEIQAINPENIINLATFEELSNLCNEVVQNLIKISDYLKTCEPLHQKDLYIQLIKGVDSLYNKLCTDGTFKKKFGKHFECVHELHNDFQDCYGPPDWAEDEDPIRICNIYRDIADCYYTKTAKLCGQEAADLMKELLVAVINSVLVVNCPNIQTNPHIIDFMPEESEFILRKQQHKNSSDHLHTYLNYFFTLLIFINVKLIHFFLFLD